MMVSHQGGMLSFRLAAAEDGLVTTLQRYRFANEKANAVTCKEGPGFGT